MSHPKEVVTCWKEEPPCTTEQALEHMGRVRIPVLQRAGKAGQDGGLDTSQLEK